MDAEDLKYKIYKAIDRVIQETAEHQPLQDYFYHPDLSKDMANAACNVLDATIKNQDYFKHENG
jgi:hypothetical protein